MDYEFFESLTAAEAQAFLNAFRTSQEEAVARMTPAAANEGICLDFSLSSLADVLKWMIKSVHVHHVPVPEEEPWWIRQAHPNGLVEFDDDSKTMLLRAGYYLGECFARLRGVHWAVGDVEYMQGNMPVIAGFRNADELPPLVVIENMFARIVGGGEPTTRIGATIEVWIGLCPSATQ